MRAGQLPFLRCPECSYDLTGLDDPTRCPECGANLPIEQYDLPCVRWSRGVGWWVLVALGTTCWILRSPSNTGIFWPLVFAIIGCAGLAWRSLRNRSIGKRELGCLRVGRNGVDHRSPRGEWNQYLLREFRHCVWRRVRPNVWRLSLRGGVWKREGHLEPKILVEIFCDDDEARLRLAELEWRWHKSRSPRRRTD